MLSAEMGERLLFRWTVAESRDALASSFGVAHDEVGLLNKRDSNWFRGINYTGFG